MSCCAAERFAMAVIGGVEVEESVTDGRLSLAAVCQQQRP